MIMFKARPALLLYPLLVAFMFATWVAGTHGIAAVRMLYLAGCIAVAWQALRLGTACHFETLIVLFAFSPFLRRVVDYGCGYDPRGLMLTGPLLAAMVPTIRLPAAIIAKKGPLAGRLAPYVLLVLCHGFAALRIELTGEYLSALVTFGKSVSVLLYGCWLLAAADDPRQVIRQGSRAFLLVVPIVGIYGYTQFIDPSPADCYWMVFSEMSSVGYPEPQQVRVFSTMNSPESLANFIVFGVVIIAFLRPRWEVLLCSGPAIIALLLSGARTAWIALAAAVLYSFFFTRTQLRASLLTALVVTAGTFAITATPLGEVIVARLQTITNAPGNDGSAMARLDELRFLFDHFDDYLIGGSSGWPGGTGEATNTQTLTASDGMIVWSVLAMGVIGGSLFVFGVIWAAMQGLARVGRRADPEFVAAGALVFGQLIVIPLNNPTGAEFGILFWSAVAIAARTPAVAGARRLLQGPAACQPGLRPNPSR